MHDAASTPNPPSPPSRYQPPTETPRFAWIRRLWRLPAPTDAQIGRFRDTLYDGDPLADALVAQVPGRALHGVVSRALEHGVEAVPDAPDALRALFAELDARPDWVDDTKLELAAHVADRVGMSGERVLNCVCLTGGYRSAAANKPLVFTGALESMAYRRLAETSRFVFDLYDSRTLPRDSQGFRGAVMVRIMHARVRAHIARDPDWKADVWGLPVNQSDMLSTNMLFSIVFVTGLRALGHIITRDEADALVHFWRYVGFLMGVRLDILPRDFQEGRQLVYLSATTQPGGDEDSRALAAALLSVPTNPDWPAWLGRLDVRWRAGFSRLMLGEREGDELGLPDQPLNRLLVLPSVAWNLSTEVVRLLIPGAEARIIRSRRAAVRRAVTRALEGKAPDYEPKTTTRAQARQGA